jgi:hypothetical protein
MDTSNADVTIPQIAVAMRRTAAIGGFYES